jgi:hypothetical protein
LPVFRVSDGVGVEGGDVMPGKPITGLVKPLEPWCAGSELPVGRIPRSGHVKCCHCDRIISVIDGKVRHHRNIPNEERFSISEAG